MINISFISQETTLFEGEAKMVVMDGQEGQLGIVKGHSPLLAVLKPGPVRMIQEEGEEVFFTNGGFAEDFAEVSSQLTQSLSQLRAIEALKKNVKLKK